MSIIKSISTKIKGNVGELKSHLVLNFLGSEYILMNDVILLNSKGSTSQIDHIVLSEYGIFVIETKNYKGWIFGNEKAENWSQILFKEKHQFRNPIKQNWSHIYALKSVLSDFSDVKYIPIVVFSGNATLKEIESNVPVVYENDLNETIRRLSTEKCISAEQVVQIKNRLESEKITEWGSHKKHIQNIKQDVAEQKVKMKNLICPRCNGELKLREGKNGKFYGCANYPRCRFTMPY